MIDDDLLRRLGWSDDLIQAVAAAAEPLRASPGSEIEVPSATTSSVAGNAIYTDVVINRTATDFTVKAPEPADTKPPSR